MIDHLTLTVSDFPKSKTFFEQALAPLGYAVVMNFGQYSGFGEKGKPTFWLKDGPNPQSPMHLAFVAKNRPAVDAFYKAALAAGATDNGPPGPRTVYHPNYYGAFVFSPDGHPIEAVCHMAIGAARVARAKKPKAKKKVAKKKVAKKKRR
jgi:catechol 2,3-dioxygenase-like lactoylglutathione lyase family enzyme